MSKCKICRAEFKKRSMTHKTCSPECAQTWAELERAKKDRRYIKERLVELQPRRYWIGLLKRVMHKFVRLRDEGKPCISCGTILIKAGRVGGDYDAGHCRSVGSAKHLEFDERNVHGQCKHCNRHLAGNYAEYVKRLPARIGREVFDALMCDQEPRKLTIEDLRRLIDYYLAKTKGLKNASN